MAKDSNNLPALLGRQAGGANLGFESELWRAADALRSSMDAAEDKHVVSGLIFLKYILDDFEEQRADEASPVIRKIHKSNTKLDLLSGLFETTIHGKQRVVEYEPAMELRTARRLYQLGIEDLGDESVDDLLPEVEAAA